MSEKKPHNGQQEPSYIDPRLTVVVRTGDGNDDGMLSHYANAECPIEGPHQMSECAWWQEPKP